MTTEEKAKAYDEALIKAKELLDSPRTCFDIVQLKDIIPELCESEDERIRKEIINYLDFAESHNLLRAADYKKKKGWLTYLEKQKDAFENGRQLGIMQEQARQELEWLDEKQKENPKSADFISADCVSSAKCEDRWHKVTDSLPDNPREVLCKDEAGNYFIGRYYVGEGWEISNYDDEDKPHHLNPPVSKWIDFPSEKQKEQPISAEEVLVRAGLKPYKDGNQWCILVGDNIQEGICGFGDTIDEALYQFLMEVFEMLKEQKPAWSKEDEQMLVRLLDSISIGNDYKEMRNWLLSKLKSIRPQGSKDSLQTHWKPSEEQMRCFDMVLIDEAMDDNVHSILVQLREQLKRLM